MIEQSVAVPRRAALYLPSRSSARPALLFRWGAIGILAARHRYAAFPLTLAASAVAGAFTTSAVLDWQDSVPVPVAMTVEPARNETVVYPRPRQPIANAEQDLSQHPYTVQIEASDEIQDADLPSNFPRAVQTLRFVNADAPVTTSAIAPRTEGLVQRALVKVHGLVAFAPKDGIGVESDKGAGAPQKRAGSLTDEVDDYLWKVYQRVPVKKDGTGDFTWKDPAAAKHAGLSMRDYVILGMDPEFREQLYHAGKAMDAAGLQWSMLSAFRDDYRQGLASGFKASVGNSLHGGSRRTGGYGHGRAIDITGAEGHESEVWHWIDAHGAKYGLHRPLPGADPAHIQQRGDSHKIAVALRESRTGLASNDKPGDKSKTRGKTAVAAAR
ncbi:MAG TPA: hypothetical protein VH678_32535 [Xanthobacteraceae bacterium]